jgi:beta-alanine degradation protein BauB
MTEAVPTIFIDNDVTRVTEWRFPVGSSTGWHRHEMNYVVVPLLDGVLRIVGPDGSSTDAQLTHGVPYYRDVGVEHDVINANDFEFAFIEVEMK